MKKIDTRLIITTLIALCVCLGFQQLAQAAPAPPDLYVEYDLGITDPSSAQKVEFLVQLGSEPTDLTYIMDVPVVATDIEAVQSFGTGEITSIPIGTKLVYYIRLTDVDGDAVLSPGYPFKIPGNPKIIFVRREK